MSKLSTTLILSFMFMAQASVVWAESQTFKVSVTIPAIIGLNVGVPATEVAGIAQSAPTWPIVEQRVVRNDKEVVLRSIVML